MAVGDPRDRAPTWSGSGACPCPLAGDFAKSDHDRLIEVSGKVSRLDESIPDRLTQLSERVVALAGDVRVLQEQIPARVRHIEELDAAVKRLELTGSAGAARTAMITTAAIMIGTGLITLAVHLFSN